MWHLCLVFIFLGILSFFYVFFLILFFTSGWEYSGYLCQYSTSDWITSSKFFFSFFLLIFNPSFKVVIKEIYIYIEGDTNPAIIVGLSDRDLCEGKTPQTAKENLILYVRYLTSKVLSVSGHFVNLWCQVPPGCETFFFVCCFLFIFSRKNVDKCRC